MDYSVRHSARARKPTGDDPVITARLPQAVFDEVNLYAEREGVTRSEAIKRLLLLGLPRTI